MNTAHLLPDLDTKLAALFAGARSAALTLNELSRGGFTPSQVAELVMEGELRKGVCGFYLPTPPDPGALAVMRAAMSSKTYDESEAL
jgi:hypothetical protein